MKDLSNNIRAALQSLDSERIRQATTTNAEEIGDIIYHLRAALTLSEKVAANLNGLRFEIDELEDLPIENIPPCETCGHIFPHSHAKN